MHLPPEMLCVCCGAELNREKSPARARTWRTVVAGAAVLIICPRHLIYPPDGITAEDISTSDAEAFVRSLQVAVNLAMANAANAIRN